LVRSAFLCQAVPFSRACFWQFFSEPVSGLPRMFLFTVKVKVSRQPIQFSSPLRCLHWMRQQIRFLNNCQKWWIEFSSNFL
jgi:hypothetical protein